MSNAIIINGFFLEDSFRVSLFDFVEFLRVLFFLEEKIVVDFFEFEGIKANISCHFAVLWLSFHYSALRFILNLVDRSEISELIFDVDGF